MNSSVSLRINTDPQKYQEISMLLKQVPSSINFGWELSIMEDSHLFQNALDFLLDILNNKIPELEKIGIESRDITLWYLYEYDGQCNLEFRPEELKKLSDLGISLCISCWEKNTSITI